MKTRSLQLSLALALALGAAAVGAAQDAKSAPKADAKESRSAESRSFTFTTGGTTAPQEKITYLGVETGPVPRALAAHLGLPPDHGLTINAVAENSPAASVLRQHDVLVKFEDQVLVDSRQLSVLIRAKKPGDDVKLTFMRAGQQQTATVKLGERELARGLRAIELGEGNAFRFLGGPEGAVAIERLRELPGLARDEINDALRIIGRERGNWFANPRVHIFRRGEKGGSTILNLAEGNVVFSDAEGTIEVVASAGDRQLTVKDSAGKVLFQGPINNDEQREQLPEAIKERLQKIEVSTFEFEAGEELEQEGGALPTTRPTKTSRPLAPPLRALPATRPF